jgi:hypothetical protein
LKKKLTLAPNKSIAERNSKNSFPGIYIFKNICTSGLRFYKFTEWVEERFVMQLQLWSQILQILRMGRSTIDGLQVENHKNLNLLTVLLCKVSSMSHNSLMREKSLQGQKCGCMWWTPVSESYVMLLLWFIILWKISLKKNSEIIRKAHAEKRV